MPPVNPDVASGSPRTRPPPPPGAPPAATPQLRPAHSEAYEADFAAAQVTKLSPSARSGGPRAAMVGGRAGALLAADDDEAVAAEEFARRCDEFDSKGEAAAAVEEGAAAAVDGEARPCLRADSVENRKAAAEEEAAARRAKAEAKAVKIAEAAAARREAAARKLEEEADERARALKDEEAARAAEVAKVRAAEAKAKEKAAAAHAAAHAALRESEVAPYADSLQEQCAVAGRADSAAQAWKEKATKGNFVVDTDAVARWRADRRGGLAALSAAACASQLRALTKARGNPLLPAALLNAKEELELRQVKAHVSTVDWALFVALLHHLRHLSISARELRRSDVCTLLLPSLLPTSGLDDFNAAYSKAARAFDAVIPKGGAPLPDWATAAPSPARPAPSAAAVDEVVDPLEMSYGGSEIPSELELSSSGVMKASPLRGAGGGFGTRAGAWRRARRRRRRQRGATRMRRRSIPSSLRSRLRRRRRSRPLWSPPPSRRRRRPSRRRQRRRGRLAAGRPAAAASRI